MDGGASILIPLSLSMAAGSMMTDNPTAKRVLGIGSLASGLGGAGLGGGIGATAGAGTGGATAASAGTVAEKAAEAAASTAGGIGGTASAAAPSFGQRLMDVAKSGTIPLGSGKLPLALPFGLASMAMPNSTGKKVMGGLGLATGLAGMGMNLFNPTPDMSVAGQLPPDVYGGLSPADISRLEEMIRKSRTGLYG